MRAYLGMLLFVSAIAAGDQTVAQQNALYNGCDTPDAATKVLPSEGPARLLGVDCPPAGGSFPSPDGQRFFAHGHPDGDYRAPERLIVSGRDKGGTTFSYPFDPSFILFRQTGFLFHWASDSRSIWGADQTTTGGGWATGPLVPLLIPPSGAPQILPALNSSAGSLDGLLWIGRDGLALAQFGTNGGRYRPERADPNPTLAFVDVKHGRTLDSLALKDFPRAVGAVGGPMVPLAIASVLLPDGRPRVLFQWPSGYSLVWTQGSEPREITLPKLPFRTSIALDPDGRRLLIAYPLSATGAICEQDDPCPPPTPVTGPRAELIDLETGKRIWRLEDTATDFGGSAGPAISPDGRYALIGMPERKDYNIALVTMQDGKIVQQLQSHHRGFQLTFGLDRRFFVSSDAYVATYELRER